MRRLRQPPLAHGGMQQDWPQKRGVCVTELTHLQMVSAHSSSRELSNKMGEIHEHQLSAANNHAKFGPRVLHYRTSDIGSDGRDARGSFSRRRA